MNNSKKAQIFEMLNWGFFRLIFISILFFTTYLFVEASVNSKIHVQDTKYLIIAKRLLYSPNSITYVDPETGRLYPGIIDLEKFNEAALDNAFNYSFDQIAIQLELKDMETNNKTTTYLNKKWYDRWMPLAVEKFNRYDKKPYIRSVLIRDGEKTTKGILRIDMVVPIE